jgi:stearoyl-CoA desaturase (delta-9 desaturase)
MSAGPRAAAPPAEPLPRSPVLRHRAGGGAQRLHAAAILVLPLLALPIAAHELWSGAAGGAQVMLALALYLLTMLGITVGFHRLLSHRAFQARPGVQAVLAILGSMAAQGPPIYWVSNHRRHHQLADAAGDPHSPHRDGERTLPFWRGLWHAHAGWSFGHALSNPVFFCKDLLRDRRLGWINRHYYGWVLLGLAAAAGAGALLAGSPAGAWNGLVWGGGVRLFLSYHLTGSINSITHRMGYRSFETPDLSRNNWVLGLVTLGEAWHNNHHAAPSAAAFGRAWWEIDVGAATIRGLEVLGLASRVRRTSRRVETLKPRPAAGGKESTP